ncbi:MAG TPA: hypothetical protein HA362_01010 [Nanoarchaeota archaeon]|nr:hypothetical protein [Nanoarchaeota archaeon]
MNNRTIGIGIIIASLILLAAIISFRIELNRAAKQIVEQNNGICIIDGECMHEKTAYPVQTYGGIIVASLLFAFGVYLAIVPKKASLERSKEESISHEEREKRLKLLNEDEKKVVEMLKQAEGTMFQSDLVEKSGFTKVKVTRILDVLEGKRLVERKRRGMTNVVILK